MSFVYEEVLPKDINFKLYLCNFPAGSLVIKAGFLRDKVLKFMGSTWI